VAAGVGKVWETDGASIGGAVAAFSGIWPDDAAAGSGDDCPPQAASSRTMIRATVGRAPALIRDFIDIRLSPANRANECIMLARIAKPVVAVKEKSPSCHACRPKRGSITGAGRESGGIILKTLI